ncbi:MAG TPA: pepsin/retropepsin-like aspartic protease family protein [Rhizomicrobium sp.]|jgi:predicted aspartyl protease
MNKGICGWIVALAFAGFFAQPAQADDQQKCQLVERAVTDMTFDRFGRPTIGTSMEGQSIPLLVDTGGTYDMLTRQTVNLLHLKPENVPEHMFYMGASGQAIKSMVNAHDFKIGQLHAATFSFLIMPYGWDESGSGAIGPDILSRYDVEFDFGAMKFHLWSPDHCPGQVVHWTQQAYMALPIRVVDNQIHFSVTVDGKEMDALLDTGASESVLRLDMARAILGWASNPPDLKCDDKGDCTYPFKSLSFGGVAVANPKIIIMPDRLASLHESGELHEKTGDMSEPPIIIGASILKRLHLYISYKERMIYATGADAH